MKKLFATFVLAALATGVFFANNTNADQDFSLSSLVSINSANAECITSSIPELNTGRCSTLTGNCYALSEPSTCDPYAF